MSDFFHFYMVWREGGPGPVKQHLTEVSACTEAKRVAEKESGSRVYILRSIGYYKTTEATWTGSE